MSKRSKLPNWSDLDIRQNKSMEVFTGAMLSQLRLQPEWHEWTPTEEEMLFGLAKTFEQIRQAHHRKDRREVQVVAADLANLAMKCFEIYGK